MANKRKKQASFLTNLLQSKVIVVIVFVLLASVTYALSKELIRKHQVNQEVELVRSEIEKVRRKNQELRELIEYLNTDSFKEIQARQNLGLQKEGETAVAVKIAAEPNTDSGEEETYDLTDKDKSNFRKWWDYYFLE